MATTCKNCPLRTQPVFMGMSTEDVARMQRFKSGELSVEPGTHILNEGSNTPQLFTALSGMGVRYKTLPDGRKQVINLIFPEISLAFRQVCSVKCRTPSKPRLR